MTPPLFVPVLGRAFYPGASVALDFTRNLYRSGTPIVKGNPANLPGWTFTRASTGYAETVAGTLVSFASGAPRITDKGLLVEEARTNLLLNSAALSTQSVTVAAVAHTLSFRGTGTVTLSGVSTAGPLVGTGTNNTVSLTFTPTAGTLTLTVTGSVTNANLEAGAFPTSWIATTGASATRAADVLKIVATNLVPLAAGTIYFESAGPPWGNDLTDHYMLDWAATSEGLARFVSGVISLHDGTGYRTLISYQTAGLAAKYAISYGGSAVNASLNGAAVVNATFDGSMASNAEAYIGCSTSGVFQWDAYIRKVILYPRAFSDAELQAATA